MTGVPTEPLIIHREKIDSWIARRRIPEAGHRIVYTDPQGRTVSVDGTLTAGEQAYRRVAWVYEVDVAPKPLWFRTVLPSKGDAFVFQASVSATWEVHDARLVVDDGGVDGAGLARGFLEAEMPRISRRHHVTQAEETEEELRKELSGCNIDLGHGISLTALSVRIELDADARAAVAAAVKEEWAASRTAAGHRASVTQTQNAGELNTLRQQQARELQRAQAAHRQELEEKEATHKAELDRERQQLQLDFERERQKHNKNVLEGGLVGALSAHLTAHPEDTGTVIQVMAGRLDKENDLVRSILQQGIEKDMIEEHQVAGVMEAAADRIRAQLSGSAPSEPAARSEPAPPSEPAAPSALSSRPIGTEETTPSEFSDGQ